MSDRKYINPIEIENARLIFKNFSGRPDKFNPNGGRRTFGLVLTKEQADELTADGWNIKELQPTDEYSDPTYFLQVKVNYGNISPNIYMIAGNKRTLLDAESVDVLDHAELQNVDIIVDPSFWEMNGRTGITAYVKTMYVTIKEDRFASKYSQYDDIPEELPF